MMQIGPFYNQICLSVFLNLGFSKWFVLYYVNCAEIFTWVTDEYTH